ncbi:MAG: DinB family protein [Gemmatimonadales bacterium]|nr:MAG: DinB family protein [Gemmatimonadales bacterium]
MDDRLGTIAAILRTNEQVFQNAITDVTESAWLHRPGDANHLAFLATHLVGARHYAVRFAGGTSTDPLEVYHGGARDIGEMSRFPSPRETLEAWNEVAPILRDTLDAITGGFLDKDHGLPFPAPGPTNLDVLTFLTQHEAYHLGQMGLLRRISGLPATQWR